jgi:hypothetical protein
MRLIHRRCQDLRSILKRTRLTVSIEPARHPRLPPGPGSPGQPGNSVSRAGRRQPDHAARPGCNPGHWLAGSTSAVRRRPASVTRSVRYQAGTLAITANCAPSRSSATANLPTPGTSLAGTTTVPPFAVTAAATTSQSATSK